MDSTINGLRGGATEQLLRYRRNKRLLRDLRRSGDEPGSILLLHDGRERPVPSVREQHLMRCWIRAIDSIRKTLRKSAPDKERFMARYFGLDAPAPRNRNLRALLIQLTVDYSVSESTLYKWRETILDMVIFAAIESGALRPYGIAADDGWEPEEDGAGSL